MGRLALLIAVLLTITACKSTRSEEAPGEVTGTAAIEDGVPGGTWTRTLEMSAEVTAVDTPDRKLTLRDPEGEEHTIEVGPEAVNFDQIEVGDRVKATLTEELVVHLVRAG